MRRTILAPALALILAACATRTAPAPPPPRPAPAPAPLSPIHQNITPLEQSFHLRAGLNVAALSCVQQSGATIITDYNRFLAAKKPQLATAYEAKAARYRAEGGNWQRALDTDMTRLYNHFAAPAAQAEFCRRAAAEVKQAIAMDPEGFVSWAEGALARLDAPFAAPAPVMMAARAAPLSATTAPTPLPAGWRIQLGAFASQTAANDAWRQVQQRSPTMAGMQPYFEPVPGKPLVRLQVKGVASRQDAIALCAHAAAAGFDCIPVAPA